MHTSQLGFKNMTLQCILYFLWVQGEGVSGRVLFLWFLCHKIANVDQDFLQWCLNVKDR